MNADEIMIGRKYRDGAGNIWRVTEIADGRVEAEAFGYTQDEAARAARFQRINPEVRLLSLLMTNGLTKDDCHAIVQRAGIELPRMYRLGYRNANCVGCVAAQSPNYWNRVRRTHPEVFARRAVLSRSLGVRLVKMTAGDRERVYLDELDPALDDGDLEPATECSLLCYMAESQLVA